MPAGAEAVSDDRVLRGTRWLSLFIAPFLVVAFVLLYLFPADTQRLFAWTITPTMTPMTLAAAYLGGAYFFVRTVREHRWSSIKAGLPAVTIFATLLGIATILHWDRFNHFHPAFWLWTFLYATAPFLVAWAWLANRRYAAPATEDEERIGATARGFAAVAGVGAFGWGAVMFIAPIHHHPPLAVGPDTPDLPGTRRHLLPRHRGSVDRRRPTLDHSASHAPGRDHHGGIHRRGRRPCPVRADLRQAAHLGLPQRLDGAPPRVRSPMANPHEPAGAIAAGLRRKRKSAPDDHYLASTPRTNSLTSRERIGRPYAGWTRPLSRV